MTEYDLQITDMAPLGAALARAPPARTGSECSIKMMTPFKYAGRPDGVSTCNYFSQ